MPVKGLDVSAFQGEPRWDLLKDEGIEYVYARCQHGNETKRDPTFAKNVSGAVADDIIPGAYWVPFPLPKLDPVEQAEMFLRAADVGGHVLGANGYELPPVIDLEWPGPEIWAKWGCTADQIIDWQLRANERVRGEVGVRLITYSYPWILQMLSKASSFGELVASTDLWIAGGPGYVNGPGVWPDWKPPVVAGWGSRAQHWQWDGNGGKRLPGTGVDADFNLFNGTIEDLRAICRSTLADAAPDTPPDRVTIAAMASSMLIDDAVSAYRRERAASIAASADLPLR